MSLSAGYLEDRRRRCNVDILQRGTVAGSELLEETVEGGVLAVAMQQKSAKCLIAKQTTGAAAGPTQVASGRRHA